MSTKRFEYYCVVEYFQHDEDYTYDDLFFKPLLFRIPEDLYLKIKAYSKIGPLDGSTKDGKEIVDLLYKIAYEAFNPKRGMMIRGISFVDYFWFKEIKSRLLNKPVIEEALTENNSYCYGVLTDDDTECCCEIFLKIENKIIIDVESIDFYEVVDDEKKPYRIMYNMAFDYIDYLESKYKI